MIGPERARMVENFAALADLKLGHISGEQLDEGWQRLQKPLLDGLPTRPRAPVSQRSPRVRAWRARPAWPAWQAWQAWIAGFATASVVAALAFVAYRARSAGSEPALGYVLEGSATSHGGAITSLSDGASVLRFSDQSRIDLGPSTNVTVEAVDARGARIGLVDGALDVYVEPRPNASWRFVAGPFRVNVKGTRFHLAFAADRGRLTLQMKSGLVEVLAPPDRTIAVGSNESLELFAEPGQAEVPPPPSAPLPVAPPVAAGLHPESAPSGGARSPLASPRGVASGEPARHRLAIAAGEPGEPSPVPWPKLLVKGDFAAVIADAERRGIGNTLAQANAVDLSSLADAARYTKRYDLARQVLLAMRERFVGADHARDASFFLGRLAEAVSDRFETALGWYETYLREAPRGPYASEALGREMALLARNAPERARRAAGQYLARFPHGPQADLARSLLEAE
jgi:ferric-dicitrate binding protein FerR (iron transport regulator)